MGLLFRLLMFALIFYLVVKGLRLLLRQKPSEQGSTGERPDRDPYRILGVSRQAGPEEIKKAYKALLAEYHPDKVSHLGKDLQELAHKKTQEISWAYQQLSQ